MGGGSEGGSRGGKEWQDTLPQQLLPTFACVLVSVHVLYVCVSSLYCCIYISMYACCVCVCVCVCVPVAVSAGSQAALRLLLLLQLRLLFPFAMLCPGPAPLRGNYFNKFKPQRNNKQFVFRLKCNFHNFLYKAPHICPFFPNLPSPHCTLPPRPHSNAPAPARALNYYLLILFIRLPRALIFHKVFPTVQLFLLSLLLLLFPSLCVCVGRHLSCISQFTYSICVYVCVCM